MRDAWAPRVVLGEPGRGGVRRLCGARRRARLRRGHRLLNDKVTPAEAKAMARRFLLGPLLYALGAAAGAALPALGLAVYAFLIIFVVAAAVEIVRAINPAATFAQSTEPQIGHDGRCSDS